MVRQQRWIPYFIACCALTMHSQSTVPPVPQHTITQSGQREADPPPDLYTLHVYTNLMQFAVVAVHSDLKPLRGLTPPAVNLTIDAGPVFHPTKLKIAGDDPLSIAVVIDASDEQGTMLHATPSAFARLLPESLRPHDRISIYAVDCAVARTLLDAAPASSEALAISIDHALSSPKLHGDKLKPACRYTVPLLDAIAFAANDLAQRPGRRVLVVVSPGRDRTSTVSFAGLSRLLSTHAIAMFALRDQADYVADSKLAAAGRSGLGSRGAFPEDTGAPTDVLIGLCTGNGGLVLNANGRILADVLRQTVSILRARYIVEFPRPPDREAATHTIDVKVQDNTAIVVSAGASAPIADPKLANDPTVLPQSESPAKVGTRHPRS